MATSILEFLLRQRKDGDAVQKTADDLKNLEDTQKKTQSSSQGLGLEMKMLEGAVIAAGVAFLKSIPALIDQGLAIKRAETALEAYAGGSKEAAAALDAVMEASGGALSTFDALSSATRLMSMGLATNAQEAGKLTEMAITLGAAMGEGPQSAFENFTLLLANQSIPRLDTFGISAAAVRERMAELTEENKDLDRQTAFLTATMEIGQTKLDDLAASGFESTNAMDRLKAKIEDSKNAVALWLAEGLMPWIEGMELLNNTLYDNESQVLDNNESYDEYVARMQKVVATSGIAGGMIEILTEAEWNAVKASRAMEGSTDDLTISLESLKHAGERVPGPISATAREMGNVDESAGRAAQSVDAVTYSLKNLTEAEIGRQALKSFTLALEEGRISAQQYEGYIYTIGTSLLGMTPAQIAANIALTNASTEFDKGNDSAVEYLASILGIASGLYSIPRTVTSTVTTYYREVHESGGGGGGGGGGLPDWYAAGGQFTVAGPPGIDRVPVQFMATAGEVVTVSAPGRPMGGGPGNKEGGIHFHFGAPIFGIDGLQQIADMLTPSIISAFRNL